MKQTRTLLGVFAHPDDESFGPGATLARYAAEGVDVHVIIATDGIAGSVEASHQQKEHETLAQVRSAELANAAVALGVTTIWSLPYRDSGMRNTSANEHPDALFQQPLEKLVEELTGYIERLQPQVIMTHDPFGGYGHPDHIRCCEAVTAAFHLTLEQGQKRNGNGYRGPQKLYYTAMDKKTLKTFVRLRTILDRQGAAAFPSPTTTTVVWQPVEPMPANLAGGLVLCAESPSFCGGGHSDSTRIHGPILRQNPQLKVICLLGWFNHYLS